MKSSVSESPEKKTAPLSHIAFIMDGNGRWAKKRGMPREAGHRFGAEAFRKIMQHCCELDIKASTFYAFSTENWKRPKKEVDSIMKLLRQYLEECEREINKNDIRFIFLGDNSVLDSKLREKIAFIEEKSKNNTHFVNIALNYGGRDEIVRAFNRLADAGKKNIGEKDISDALYTRESPELDLLVRTGGELRISNFLLWQSAYAELYFSEKLWPDFTPRDVDAALEDYKKRKRRFGGV